MRRKRKPAVPVKISKTVEGAYRVMLSQVIELLNAARRASARAVNALMTATYWELGRQIVESEQRGARRAEYGEELILRLSVDLTKRFGRGFSERNLEQMRLFYLTWKTPQTLSAKLEATTALAIPQTPSAESVSTVVAHGNAAARSARQIRALSRLRALAERFPLPCSSAPACPPARACRRKGRRPRCRR